MCKFRNESHVHYGSRYVVNHPYDYTQRVKNLIIFQFYRCATFLRFILTILTLQIMKDMLKINTPLFTLHADNA